jgi:hypothetical protein
MTTQQVWDEIDRIATEEAAALSRSKKYMPRAARLASRVVSRDQLLYDEQLDIHATQCAFCGKSLRDDPLDTDLPLTVSIHGQQADICQGCLYLAQRVFQTAHTSGTL